MYQRKLNIIAINPLFYAASAIQNDINTPTLGRIHKHSRGSTAVRHSTTVSNSNAATQPEYSSSPSNKRPSTGIALDGFSRRKRADSDDDDSVDGDKKQDSDNAQSMYTPIYLRPRKRTTILCDEKASPGPGHYWYSEMAVMARPISFSIVPADAKRDKSASKDYGDYHEPPIPVQNFRAASNYQKFGTTRRFPYNQCVYEFNVGNARNKSNESIISRNKTMISAWQRRDQEISGTNTSMRREYKIKAAQNTKEIIEEEEKARAIKRMEEIDKRKFLKREEKHAWKLCRNWLSLMTMLHVLGICHGQYDYVKKMHQMRDKYFRIFYFCVLTVGKLLVKLRKFRNRKFMRVLRVIARSKTSLWKARSRIRSSKNLTKFVQNYSQIRAFMVLAKTVMLSITKIQKWYRRYLTKKIFLLSLMNLLWDSLERLVLNSENPNDAKNPTLIKRAIRKYFGVGKEKSEVVPVRARIHFILSAMKSQHVFIDRLRMSKLVLYSLTKRKDWQKLKNSKAIPYINLFNKVTWH